MKHDGSNSLAVVLNVDYSTTFYASVAVPICSSAMPIAGHTMSAWLYFLGTTFDQYTFLWFTAWSASDQDRVPAKIGSNIPVNQWVNFTVTFPDSVNADHVAIQLSPGTNWNGTMYIDSVTLTPP